MRIVTGLGLWLMLSASVLAQKQVVQQQADFVDENMITHGPILGRISSTGVGVWARTLQTGTFTVLYGTDSARLDQSSPPVATSLEHDNTGWVHIQGLKPGTKYWYELKIPESTGRTGRRGSFHTFPDSEALRHPEWNPKGLFNFSFEAGSCANQNPRHSIGPELPAFVTMLREIEDDIHFSIMNGDSIYEVRREFSPEEWAGALELKAEQIPQLVKDAPTITGVWENYKFYLDQGRALADWHREVPCFFTYDDHELLNDIYGTGTPGVRDRRVAFRDIGVRAWYDYFAWANPTEFDRSEVHLGRCVLKSGSDVLLDESSDFTKLNLADHNNLIVHWGTPTAGVNDNALDNIDDGDPNAGVYRVEKVLGPHQLQIFPAAKADSTPGYGIGKKSWYKVRAGNCEFYFLDTRGQRDMHNVKDPFAKNSILGAEQRQWLFDGLRQSDADFLFLISSVNFTIPHVGGGAIRDPGNKDEAWTVFLSDREALIELADDLPQPVIVFTGDLHNSFAVQISDNVFEMGAGPHNSVNHWDTDEGNRPANGKFQSGPREVDILWSTHFRSDIPRDQLLHPTYLRVQVNNVYNNPKVYGQPDRPNEDRWIAYPRPQLVFSFFDGRTGELRFAHSIRAAE